MPYFTSWDINVFLCLLSLGLPEYLAETFVKKIKKNHEELELMNSRDFHCDRGQFVDMSEWQMLYYSRADLNDREWHFPKAISSLESIPVAFHNRHSHLVEHYKREIKYYLSNDRVNYFKLSGPGGEKEWSPETIKWFEGFHPGRFLLMDYKFINSILKWSTHKDTTRVWRVNGQGTFNQWYNHIFEGKKHIDDLLEERTS
jgi:hypothetical protein